MNRAERDLIVWEQVSRVHVTTWYTVGTLVAPQSSFLSPHLSVTAILLAIVFGLLITLLHWQGGVASSTQRTGVIGGFYILLVAGPFLLAWFICSWTGWPLLLAVPVAHIVPVLLIVVAFLRSPLQDPGLILLDRLLQAHRGIYSALALSSSLFIGYGLPFLSLYLYTQLTQQIFGHLAVANLGLMMLIGGLIAGGIYGLTQRTQKRAR